MTTTTTYRFPVIRVPVTIAGWSLPRGWTMTEVSGSYVPARAAMHGFERRSTYEVRGRRGGLVGKVEVAVYTAPNGEVVSRTV